MSTQKETFHRKIEGAWVLFTVLTLLSVLVGTVIEIAPMFLVKSNIPTISTVKPLTPLELAGRDIYQREGCVNCHSQMVRPFRDELERYGEYGKPGESIYDHPFLWGSKRTGPDLSRVGGKYPNLWHVRHMENPRSTSPRSLMPNYYWLLEYDLDLTNLSSHLSGLRTLGVPYTDREVSNAASLAQEQAKVIADDVAANGGPKNLQNKEIIAIVAYLQRLGKDLKAAPTANVNQGTSTNGGS
ncbi:MAG: cytochrome-c oxidase, cbb3-type subunit II [Rhodothermia bacterium]|nr:cytochrome-c oxidase, cbb3-type subunit II [Rhodothermia bacterium]